MSLLSFKFGEKYRVGHKSSYILTSKTINTHIHNTHTHNTRVLIVFANMQLMKQYAIK